MAIVALSATLALAACGGGDDEGVVLDGRPRLPDAMGVVREITFERVTLVDGRTWRIERDVQSFATQTMQAVPILQRKGQFVHLGTEGDRVIWLAAVGSVFAGDPPTVLYTGRVVTMTKERVTFSDGTVLPRGEADGSFRRGAFLQVEIDADTGRTRSLRTP